MLPFIHAHHHHHHHVTFQTAHLPPVTHSWIPKHRLWQRCLWIRPGDECPDKTSAVSKGKHTHTYTQTHILQYTTSIRKTKPKKKRTKERGEAPAFPLLPPNPCPPTLPPIRPSPLSPKIRSKGQKKQGGEEKEEKRRSQRYEELQGESEEEKKKRRRWRSRRKRSRRRYAWSSGPKNQKVTQNQKLLLLLLLVMCEWLKRNETKYKQRGGGRGREGVSKALSVCSSLTVIAVLVYQTEIVPCLPLPATSLCSHFLFPGWIKYGLTSTNWLWEYIYFCFCFP